MNNAEDIRAYTINEDGIVTTDMKTVRYKCHQRAKAARLELAEQAKRETTETLRRVVEECAGTYLAHLAAKELARRAA